MLNFVCLGILCICEIFYLTRRRGYLPSRSKSQTRARWFALFFFCYAALLRWEILSLLSLQSIFVFIWGRGVHMTVYSKLIRQLIWIIGGMGMLTVLLLSLLSDDHAKMVYSIWCAAWGVLYSCVFVALIMHGHRQNIEYDHLMWSTILILLGVIPIQFASLNYNSLPGPVIILSIFLVLYLRIRLPNIVGSFFHPEKYTVEFMRKSDTVHIDSHSIYDILNDSVALKRYLSLIDKGVRDLFIAIDYDTSKYVSGYYTDSSSLYKDFLNTIGIPYSNDIFLMRKQLIDYMHEQYDRTIFGGKMKFFFCPCFRPQNVSGLNEDDESDPGIELDNPSSYSSSEEIVYAELRDFNSSEEMD